MKGAFLDHFNSAQSIAVDIDKLKKKRVKGNTAVETEANKKAKKEEIGGKLRELASHTKHIFGFDSIPQSSKEGSGLKFVRDSASGFCKSMSIDILTKKHGQGTDPSGSGPHPVFDIINQRRHPNSDASYYIKGHMLNEKLGGLGVWTNLTALTRQGNKDHESFVESQVKAAVRSGAVVNYKVTANYPTNIVPKADADDRQKEVMLNEVHVPHSLHCEVSYLKKENNVWVSTKVIDKEIDNKIDTKKYHFIGSIKLENLYLPEASINQLLSITFDGNNRILYPLAKRIKSAFTIGEQGSTASFASFEALAKSISTEGETDYQTIMMLSNSKLNYNILLNK